MPTKLTAAAVATIAAAATGAVLTAGPANADTSTNKCSASVVAQQQPYTNTTVSAHCGPRTDGKTEFRAKVRCTDGSLLFGDWQGVGRNRYSQVSCRGHGHVDKKGYQLGQQQAG